MKMEKIKSLKQFKFTIIGGIIAMILGFVYFGIFLNMAFVNVRDIDTFTGRDSNMLLLNLIRLSILIICAFVCGIYVRHTTLIGKYNNIKLERDKLKRLVDLDVQNFVIFDQRSVFNDKLNYLKRCIAEYRVRKR